MHRKILILSMLSGLTATGCDSSEFSEAASSKQAFKVQVVDDEVSADAILNPPEKSSSSSETVAIDRGNNRNPETKETKEVKGPKETDGIGGTPGGKDTDIADCAKLSGLDAINIKVSGSTKDIKLSSSQALAMKVTGNQNSVDVDLASQPATTSIKAICLFVAGNQNVVHFDIGIHVGALFVIARGNNPLIEVATTKDAIIDSVNFNEAGNGGQLLLQGEGSFPCDSAKGIVCSKK